MPNPAPFFSIITPTLDRPSLGLLCQTLENQTARIWEHIVVHDRERSDSSRRVTYFEGNWPRIHVECGVRHNDGGNTCRSTGLSMARGEWVWFADDDNFVAHERALEEMAEVLSVLPSETKWALFPIVRLGQPFYTDPPRSCHVDTMNFVLRREIAYWPQTDAYGTDGILVDDLIARKVTYAAFPNFRPIGVIPKISFCR